MADTKISALTEATAPAAADVLPIVSGGATKKVRVDKLLQPIATGNVLANVSGASAVPTAVPITDPGTGQPTASVAGLDAAGAMKGVYIPRTGALATLLALAGANGELAVADNAKKIVAQFATGTDAIGPMQVASLNGTPVNGTAAGLTTVRSYVTGFRPKLIFTMATDFGVDGNFGQGFSIGLAVGLGPNSGGVTDNNKCFSLLFGFGHFIDSLTIINASNAAETRLCTAEVSAITDTGFSITYIGTTAAPVADNSVVLLAHAILAIGD